MSEYYKGKRSRNLFDPEAKTPFKLSRTKLELFLKCPYCFYMDRRLGVSQPAGFPFTLNAAVDHLLKKEFDIHRAENTAHPLMKEYGIDAVPFSHPELANWRENFTGIQYHHQPTNFLVFGAVDDIWQTPAGELAVVDYKATSKDTEVNLEADWQRAYKNQVEIYQWLFRQNGFRVSPIAYFVYVNGRRDRAAFDGRLEFDVTILPYQGNDNWVENALVAARRCLMADKLPAPAKVCDFCAYRQAAVAAGADKD